MFFLGRVARQNREVEGSSPSWGQSYCSMGERQPSRLLLCHKRKLPVGSNPTTTANSECSKDYIYDNGQMV